MSAGDTMPSTAVTRPTEKLARLTRHRDVNETIKEYDRTAHIYDEVRINQRRTARSFVSKVERK